MKLEYLLTSYLFRFPKSLLAPQLSGLYNTHAPPIATYGEEVAIAVRKYGDYWKNVIAEYIVKITVA